MSADIENNLESLENTSENVVLDDVDTQADSLLVDEKLGDDVVSSEASEPITEPEAPVAEAAEAASEEPNTEPETPVAEAVEAASEEPNTEPEVPVAEAAEVASEESISEPETPVAEAVPEKPKPADYSSLTKEEILEKLRYFIHETNVDESKSEIDALKSQFYRRQKQEHEQVERELKEQTGDASAVIGEQKDSSEIYLNELLADYKRKRAELVEAQQLQKIENLKRKKEIIDKIQSLVNGEESLNKTFNDFKALQQEWMSIGPVPSADAKSIWESYQMQIERFYDFVKINKELRDLDFKRNLEQKLELCEKAENLLLEPNVVVAYKSLQEYHSLWRELGPVPADKRVEIWDRFREAGRKIRQNYQEHFEKLKAEREANYEQKLVLCDKAEQIFADGQPDSAKDWAQLSAQIVELQNVWKTIGMVPAEVNVAVYNRFRNACNKFFTAKKEYYNVLNEELNSNLQAKLELCVNAESIQHNTDWKKTTDMFIELQRKWKDIGPIPRKNSEQVWKRFRTACDCFFNAKSDYFKNTMNESRDNLQKKEELIAEVRAFVPVDNQAENIEKIKQFQTRWTEIGYVTAPFKDKLYADYKAAINELYDRLDLNRNSIEMSNFNAKLQLMKDGTAPTTFARERQHILAEIDNLNKEILQIENNMSFFSSGTNNIVKDFQKKIDKLQGDIQVLKDKKKAIDIAEREAKKANEDKSDK